MILAALRVINFENMEMFLEKGQENCQWWITKERTDEDESPCLRVPLHERRAQDAQKVLQQKKHHQCTYVGL